MKSEKGTRTKKKRPPIAHIVSANNPNAPTNNAQPGDEVIFDMSHLQKGFRVKAKLTKIVTQEF